MWKSIVGLVLSVLFIHLCRNEVYAKIVINEVLPNPSGTDDGAEWVELYNTNSEPVSLSGCVLRLHATDNYQNVTFGSEDFIDKYKVVTWNDPWLSNTGDTVRMVCPSETDIVAYGDSEGAVVSKPDEGISFGRNPDSVGNFTILAAVTLGEPNSNPPTSTPLPTNSPTLTPKPMPTLKPTSTPKPTLTSKPVSSPTNTPTTKPTNTSTLNPSVSEYPDLEDDNVTPSNNINTIKNTSVKGISVGQDKEMEDEGGGGNNKVPIPAIALIVLGTIFISVSMIPLVRKFKKR